MKLITWNIQWGCGMDGRVDLDRIVATAKALADFDVLCLQEVSDGFPDLAGSAGENQFREIATRLPGFAAVEGVNVDLPGESGGRKRFGNMILSRLPVGRILRHALPWEADPTTRNMPRGLLDVEVSAPGGVVRIMTTHLEYFSPALRQSQVEAIAATVRRNVARAMTPPQAAGGTYAMGQGTASTILTGDFNLRADDPVRARLTTPLASGGAGLHDTWEALHPGVPHPPSFCIADQTYGAPHCCDFLLVSDEVKARLRHIGYETETRASDHQPVLLDIDI
jgi:endonuclease/exonuclease/phosphatase family metal-dependent hydrolase